MMTDRKWRASPIESSGFSDINVPHYDPQMSGLRRDRTCWPSWALSANCDVQSPIRYVRSTSASRRFEPFTVHLVGLGAPVDGIARRGEGLQVWGLYSKESGRR